MRYYIEDTQLEEIGDAIRYQNNTNQKYTPHTMAEAIRDYKGSLDTTANAVFSPPSYTRPNTYPDFSNVDMTDFDGVYLVYDLNKTPNYGFISFYATTKTTATGCISIDRGHLSNNVFVSDESFTMNSGTYFHHTLDSANGSIQIWRITSTLHLSRISFVGSTGDSATTLWNFTQPCVERYGRLPWVENLSSTVNSTWSSGCWATLWMVADHVKDVVSVTNMSGAWNSAYNLRDISFDGWDTTKCTNFAGMFKYCRSLETVDLTNINFTKATTLAEMFYNCYSINNIDLRGKDIDLVTTFASMFYYCRNLSNLQMDWVGTGKLTAINTMFYYCDSLDGTTIYNAIKNLNVSNVGSMASLFEGCFGIKRMDLSCWTVDKVTSVASMFKSCRNVKYINLSGWDVSNVTSMAEMCNTCWNLIEINLTDWSPTKVTTLASMFSNCWSIKHLDFANWDISKVTTIASMCYDCYSLESIDLTGWDVPNVMTTIASAFYLCYSLKALDVSGWTFTKNCAMASFLNSCSSLTSQTLNISDWTVAGITTFDSFFSGCMSLEEIDLTSWQVTSAALGTNTLNYVFNGVRNVKSIKAPVAFSTTKTTSYLFADNVYLEYLDLGSWDLSAATSWICPNQPLLRDFYPPVTPAITHSYAAAYSLTPESLVRILNALPTLSTAKTITLGALNKNKLTADQIAIATNKGWTVA